MVSFGNIISSNSAAGFCRRKPGIYLPLAAIKNLALCRLRHNNQQKIAVRNTIQIFHDCYVGVQRFILLHIICYCYQFVEHMLEEHVNTERSNIYKMFNLRIPSSKHEYHCSREAPVGEKLLPTNFKNISLCLGSTRIFLCIQSCVYTLIEQTMLSQCQFGDFDSDAYPQQGMLTLELCSILLEIPYDAYTILNRNLIGCLILSQVYCKLIG